MGHLNITAQCCGLVVVCLLLIFYLSSKRIGLRSEKTFILAMVVSIVSLILDISSLFAIRYLPIGSTPLNIICKTYLVSLVFAGGSAFIYIFGDCYVGKKFKSILIAIGVITMVEGAVILNLPISYHVEDETIYTLGPSVMMTYACALFYVFLTIVLMAVFRKRINSRRRLGVGLWLGIWIAAALVQFFNNDILLVGFACSLGMLILFIVLENPDANIDRQAGCFHAHALSEYLRQSFMRQEPFGMISFSPVTKPEVNADSFEDILAFLKLHKNIKYFKNIYDEAVVVFREGYDCDAFIDEFGKYFGSSMKAYIVLLRNALPLNNTVNLLSVFEYMNRRIRSHANEYYAEISENTLSDYLRLSKMEDEIISAIANERIEIFLQPIYNVSLERFNSAEVLIRMKNDEGKYVSPSEFIPIAEETGIIVELGEIVFTKACEFLRDCRGKSGIDYLEINLSVVQCETPDLAERILAIMEEYGVNPDWINLEITETASTNMGKNFQANIQTLIDHGIKFSLDDFGKGESNLMYLVNVPVSIVKFDIDMTKAAYANPKAKYVMNYTVQMAHKLGMYTVAEGIESLQELEGMKETGIDYIQGYYFSRPLPPVDFMQFCESHLLA